jgi:hypothetical protein
MTAGAKGQEKPMLEQDTTARIRATIEDELGSFRAFANLPATELEEMAERITRAITPLLGSAGRRVKSRAA